MKHGLVLVNNGALSSLPDDLEIQNGRTTSGD